MAIFSRNRFNLYFSDGGTVKKILSSIKKYRVELYLKRLKDNKHITGYHIDGNKIYLNIYITSIVLYFYENCKFLKIKEDIISQLCIKYKYFEMEWI